MKKVILALVLIAGSFTLANAQSNAIGLRLGYGAEVSYQRTLGNANRIEADLGIDFGGGLNVAGTYQWVWDLSALAPGFNWYAGPGIGLGLWDRYFTAGILGQIGIEYNFNIPLQLSLDWRPGLYFHTSSNTNVGFSWSGFALGVRYKF